MRRSIYTLSAIVAAATLTISAAQDARPSSSLERRFAAGGTARLDLSAGGYTIKAGHDDKIAIRWSTKTAYDLGRAKVSADVQGTTASISAEGPNNFNVVVELPVRTDLEIRLTAGDLEVIGFEGNKDIRARAGDVSIDVGRANDYGPVDASVTAGEIDAEPFNISKGGLFRSFDWKGPGKYRLHASLWAGDLTLSNRKH